MEDFVTFEIAKKLKEKGFSLKKTEIYGKFDNDGLFHPQLYFNYIETMDCDEIIAPTISQVLKWLREEKKLYVGVTYSPKIEGSQDFYYATIQYIGDYKKTIYPNDSYDNWEEAALNGINYVLDNLIMKRFNELHKLVTTQPLFSTDLPIMVDGKLVKEMTINYDNEFPVIELKTE